MPCQYNYRPGIFGHQETRADHQGTCAQTIYLPGTKPLATCRLGRQIFPTQRALGSRALVCDTFARRNVTYGKVTLDEAVWANDNPDYGAAYGLQAHVQGYNVLYADGHASWYGDPQQRIIWWPIMGSGDGGTSKSRTSMYGPNLYDDWRRTDHPYYPSAGRLGQSHEIWHLMDVANDVDVQGEYTSVQ